MLPFKLRFSSMGCAMARNNVKKLREAQLMSKAELARKAGVSPLTVDRVEKGEDCRMDTKRKIILALGFSLGDREKVFLDQEEDLKTSRSKKSIKGKGTSNR
jgi:DNA-binding XRE family transcriptional regulator